VAGPTTSRREQLKVPVTNTHDFDIREEHQEAVRMELGAGPLDAILHLSAV